MHYQELEKRTTEFCKRIRAFTKPLLRSVETQDDARQLRRAANGMRANYRSAAVSRTHREFISRLAIVLEESDESQGWLQLLNQTDFQGNTEVLELLKEATELRNIFAASYATAKRNEGGKGGRRMRR